MKKELYLWIRNLAVFYIFFTAVLNLVPDKKYEKYVRFFMGLLLIFMMSTPILSGCALHHPVSESDLHLFSEVSQGQQSLFQIPSLSQPLPYEASLRFS